MSTDASANAAAIRERLEQYADGKPFRFNPDKQTLDGIFSALAKRHSQYGADYCPCRRVTNDREQDAKIICPCVYHLDELENDGHCHCFLFVKP